MSSTTDNRSRPPATSLAIVVGLTAGLVSLLLAATGGDGSSLVGLGAAVLLALSLWLVRWERWRAVGTFAASVLVAPVAVGLVVAGVGTLTRVDPAAITQTSQIFTDILAPLLVMVGCMVAVFGAAASTRTAYDSDTIDLYFNTTFKSIFVLLLAGGALFASDAADFSGSETGPLAAMQLVGDAIEITTGVLFDPAAGRTHLGVFCLLLSLALIGLNRAIDALPLTELAPEHTDGPNLVGAIERVVGVLGRGGVVLFTLGSMFWVVELAAEQSDIRELLPQYELVAVVTGASVFRVLFWRTFVAGVAIAVAVWLLRRTVQSSADHVGTVLAPYAGGAVLTLVGLVAAGPAVDAIRTALRGLSQGPTGQVVDQLLLPALDFYSAGTVVLLGFAAVLAVASTAAAALWIAVAVRYVPERTAGVAVAAGGLFIASASGAAHGISAVLALAGLVGAVVVWDAGTFGTTLRYEIGPGADSRRTELIHTVGTAVVGCVGAALTTGLLRVPRGSVSVQPEAALAGLLLSLVAVFALTIVLK